MSRHPVLDSEWVQRSQPDGCWQPCHFGVDAWARKGESKQEPATLITAQAVRSTALCLGVCPRIASEKLSQVNISLGVDQCTVSATRHGPVEIPFVGQDGLPPHTKKASMSQAVAAIKLIHGTSERHRFPVTFAQVMLILRF
jgi:hypothetical protein